MWCCPASWETNSIFFRITFWRASLSRRLRTPIGVHILIDREVSVNSFLHVNKYLYRMQIVIYRERKNNAHVCTDCDLSENEGSGEVCGGKLSLSQ